MDITNLNIVPPKEEKNDFERLARRSRIRSRAVNAFVYTMLGIWAIIVLFPFYWMLLTSFKTQGSFNAEVRPAFFPSPATFENYIDAFVDFPLGQWFLNTFLFTLITTALMLVIIIPASYAFARLEFRGKTVLFTLFLAMMMIPSELVVITNYYTMTDWNLRNTLMGLVLPSVASVFYIYLLRENFAQVPDQLYKAAKVDGTSDFKYMWKVMIPICKPTIITIIILKVIECWNSYAWPRLITDVESRYLVSQGAQMIRDITMMGNYPGMMAAVVTVSIPLIALFIIFRNKIMQGVARGGTKG